MKRRDVLRLAATAAAARVAAAQTNARRSERDLLQYLCPPDGFAAPFLQPSPKADPFVAGLFVPPIAQPVRALDPPPDPRAHQRYEQYLPKKFYTTSEVELKWQYHPHPPYDKRSWSWGFDGTTPGPTFHTRYGEPVLGRRFNNLPVINELLALDPDPDYFQYLRNKLQRLLAQR